jgi:hypothetical protein
MQSPGLAFVGDALVFDAPSDRSSARSAPLQPIRTSAASRASPRRFSGRIAARIAAMSSRRAATQRVAGSIPGCRRMPAIVRRTASAVVGFGCPRGLVDHRDRRQVSANEPGRSPSRSRTWPAPISSGGSAGVAGRHAGSRSAKNRATVSGSAGSASSAARHQVSNRAHCRSYADQVESARPRRIPRGDHVVPAVQGIDQHDEQMPSGVGGTEPVGGLMPGTVRYGLPFSTCPT